MDPRRPVDSLARSARDPGPALAALVVAALAGVVVYVLGSDLFAYHSVNDDEAVYLLQAALLLDGEVFLRPGALGEAVRPWFFVVDRGPAGLRMYAKYTPVAAAAFAVGGALGDWHLALGLVAAGSVGLTYALASAAFDRRAGLVAALALPASPMFLLTSATFLSYAPTTLLNLAFAVAYVRAARRGSRRWALVAGTAIGLAFFARPYTAVLFALPFVAHTLARLWRARRVPCASRSRRGNDRSARTDARPFRREFARSLAVALPGLAFVGVALSYNALVTGDPLTFPYQAFGPHDGLGFGRHALLGYERVYTPALAAETTVRASTDLAVDWAPAGLLGTALALVGAGRFLVGAWGDRTGVRDAWLGRSDDGSRHGRPAGEGASDGGSSAGDASTDGSAAREPSQGESGTRGPSQEESGTREPSQGESGADGGSSAGTTDREVAAILLGVVPSVILGEAYFWGTLNGYENGLIDLLGPYYHFDLLVPLAAFAGAGTVALGRRIAGAARRQGLSTARRRALFAALLVASVPVAASAERAVLADPIEDNRDRTENLAAAYAPIERTDFDRALVFTPDTYGDWQAHPFQYLRNGPGFDGDVIYATDGPPARNFRVLDAASGRRAYRFTYRGPWAGATREVTPALVPLRVRSGDRIRARTTVGAPAGAATASVRVETSRGYARYAVDSLPANGTLPVVWSVGSDGVAVRNLARAAGPERVPLPDGTSEVDLSVTFVGEAGASVTYRQEVTVEARTDSVRAIWPPETRVCRLRTDCGHEGAWVGESGEYLRGVSVETRARTIDETGHARTIDETGRG
jgi:hypothetical protein